MLSTPKTPKTPKATKTPAKPRRIKQEKIKQEKIEVPMPPTPPTPEPPTPETPPALVLRLPNGLRTAWEVQYKGDVEPVPYHSIRDVAFGLRQRGVDVKKSEKLRAFLRRHATKKAARKCPKWLDTVKSISRVGTENAVWCAPDAEGEGASDGFGETHDDTQFFEELASIEV